MFCKKCGNEMPDGTRFCNRCGEPLTQAGAPFGGTNPAGGFVNKINIDTPSFLKGGDSTTWIIVAFIFTVLTMISMILSGVGASFMGVASFSMPNTSVAMALDIARLPIGTGAFGVYRVFLFIYLLIAVVSLFLTVRKSSAGVIAGMLASAVAVIMSIVVIIASFGFMSRLAALDRDIITGMVSTYPTFWTWIALIAGLLNGAFLLVKGKDIVA